MNIVRFLMIVLCILIANLALAQVGNKILLRKADGKTVRSIDGGMSWSAAISPGSNSDDRLPATPPAKIMWQTNIFGEEGENACIRPWILHQLQNGNAAVAGHPGNGLGFCLMTSPTGEVQWLNKLAADDSLRECYLLEESVGGIDVVCRNQGPHLFGLVSYMERFAYDLQGAPTGTTMILAPETSHSNGFQALVKYGDTTLICLAEVASTVDRALNDVLLRWTDRTGAIRWTKRLDILPPAMNLYNMQAALDNEELVFTVFRQIFDTLDNDQVRIVTETLLLKLDANDGTERFRVHVPEHYTYLVPYTLKVLPDGQILLAGFSYKDVGSFQVALSLVCFNKNGDLNWYVDTTFENKTLCFANDIAVASSGDIYVGGYAGVVTKGNPFKDIASRDLLLAQFSPTGQLKSYNIWGSPNTADQISKMTISNDGNILIAGYTGAIDEFGADGRLYLAKVNTQSSSVFENSPSVDVSVFPNPVTSGKVTLTFSPAFSAISDVSVFDDLGRDIGVGYVDLENGSLMLNVGDLHPGVYYARVRSGNLTATKKFILSK